MDSKQTPNNTKHTNIRLPIELYAKIEALALAGERTVSGQIRYMLSEYIKIKES